MSWWEAITDRGRSLRDVDVRFEKGELHVRVWGLEQGEKTAVLIDHMKKHAYVFDAISRCQQLAAAHNYELTTKETLQDRVTRELHEFEDLENRLTETEPAVS